jgi:predicted TIM-barrel fold metal-dependent hydrolase
MMYDSGAYYMDGGRTNGMHNGDSDQYDDKGGRSPMSRRMYMEAKSNGRDKASQLRELEKYMQELSQDITEMIADASPEEKQYLEKKITALASKIGQMK